MAFTAIPLGTYFLYDGMLVRCPFCSQQLVEAFPSLLNRCYLWQSAFAETDQLQAQASRSLELLRIIRVFQLVHAADDVRVHMY